MDTFTVSGCRASGGGLHIGHVYGCLQDLPDDSSLYFVISDLISEAPEVLRSSALEIARDVRAALPTGVEVRVVRESRLQDALFPILARVLASTTFGGIVDVHPKRVQLRSGTYKGPIQDFLFPAFQAAYLIGLACSTACYNDDNSRFVDFARRSRRRLIMTGDAEPAVPTLRLRSPSRLLGHDGRKMSKNNGNTLMLAATHSEVSRFAARLVGRANTGPDFDGQGVSDVEKVYIHAFAGSGIPHAMSAIGRARVESLAEFLGEYVTGVQGRRASMARSDAHEERALEHDEELAKQTIRQVAELMITK